MSIQFSIRDFCYPLSIAKLRILFERSQWWPLSDLLGYQEQLLRRTVVHAYQQVPYYQELFRKHHLRPADIQTVADLQKLPSLSKATLRTAFPQLQALDKSRYRPRMHRTSGTSGEPLHFLLDKPANVLEFVYYWRHWSWAGYRLGNRFAELSSHYFLQDESRARRPYCYQQGFGRLLLNSLSLSSENVEKFASAIRKYQPLFLKGIASALTFFALFCKQRGITDLVFRGIFSTGEILVPSQRRLIEEIFRGKVHDSYGHMERTVAVAECSQGGLHINPEYGVFELVDKKPLAPGESTGPRRARKLFGAKVVGTSLHNRSMPLLRYEVGDVVEVEEPCEPCPCGRDMPRIRRINGRQEDVITTPDGRVVTTLFIVFNQIAGVAFGQIVQEDLDWLVVRIVRAPDYAESSEAELLCYIRRFVGPKMRITVEYLSAQALRRRNMSKLRTVLSYVPPGAAHETTNQFVGV
jgi:phenylacetate-CoA ligase